MVDVAGDHYSIFPEVGGARERSRLDKASRIGAPLRPEAFLFDIG